MYARERADDVLRMHRLARSGGTKALLRWLSGRAGGWAGLLDGDGTVLHAFMHAPDDCDNEAAALAAQGAKELADRDLRSFALDGGAHTALLFPLEGPPRGERGPVLAVVAARPLRAGLQALLADVMMPLTTCWEAESVERKRRRVDLTESRSREAVLHLLMAGQLSTAHQIAAALRPRLPDPAHVYVVECPGGRRDDVARLCVELSDGRAWIVRCPVYSRHLIIVVPAGPDALEQAAPPLDRVIASTVDDSVVGVSEEVPLRETAIGYEQAFHALAVARGRAERRARFGASPELALVIGGTGADWADSLLEPLLAYVPQRTQDPGSQELLATVTSWLAFSSHATRHLKIHRNTLAMRLRLIGELLSLDLTRLADQAALALTLRIRATAAASRPVCPGAPLPQAFRTLDDILSPPAVQQWALQQLRPLASPQGSADARVTLRTWLAQDSHLGSTAAALGISVPGVRKRLTRLEAVLGRSLLHAPSARHDLWLAFRALDVACRT